ncbi:MAG: hypothetical protein FWG51_01695 [Firmicutes bacterium]|nr:hypothetical protein [Bacillota bacterium]
MEVIFSKCDKDGACLVSFADIVEGTNSKLKLKFNFFKKQTLLSEEEVLEMIKNIALDNYFEFLPTEKKGEQMYLFTLKDKGVAFKRELVNERRVFYYRIYLAAAGAIVAGLIATIFSLIR